VSSLSCLPACKLETLASLIIKYDRVESYKLIKYPDDVIWSEISLLIAQYASMLILDVVHELHFVDMIVLTNTAVYHGQIALLEWVICHSYELTDSNLYNGATSGSRIAFRWLIEHDCPYDNNIENIGNTIIRLGHLDILKYNVENGYELTERDCTLAASGCQLHILIWLREQGVKWNTTVCICA
jgi:hypothetical protein